MFEVSAPGDDADGHMRENNRSHSIERSLKNVWRQSDGSHRRQNP